VVLDSPIDNAMIYRPGNATHYMLCSLPSGSPGAVLQIAPHHGNPSEDMIRLVHVDYLEFFIISNHISVSNGSAIYPMGRAVQ